jgi:dihydrofolate reductase
MGIVKVAAFSISLDGFSAGPSQDINNPLGLRGPEIFDWFFKTKMFDKMHGNGEQGGGAGVDNDWAEKSFENVGSWILGRNMFGPIRGPWADESWKGWWGEEPPYHVPVFVLTHHPRSPIAMKGGTVFHFVSDGISSALTKAKEAAKAKDVRIGGGVATIRQYLQAGLIDQMHLAYSPVYIGKGENLLTGIDLSSLGFKLVERVYGENAMHVLLRKSA